MFILQTNALFPARGETEVHGPFRVELAAETVDSDVVVRTMRLSCAKVRQGGGLLPKCLGSGVTIFASCILLMILNCKGPLPSCSHTPALVSFPPPYPFQYPDEVREVYQVQCLTWQDHGVASEQMVLGLRARALALASLTPVGTGKGDKSGGIYF